MDTGAPYGVLDHQATGGFVPFFRTYTDPQSGVVYLSMVLKLPERA